MEKVNCTKCNGIAVKNGFQGEIQRYKCKLCHKKFQLDFTYKAYNVTVNDSIIILLKEGCGIRSIARILRISKNTVLARIISIGEKLKEKPLL
jgi:insertion element IS1 protein InsB